MAETATFDPVVLSDENLVELFFTLQGYFRPHGVPSCHVVTD